MKKHINFSMHAPWSFGLALRRAVVKYGTIITEIKGKVGGNVFQGGTAGPQMKNKQNFGRGHWLGSGKLTKADAGRVIQSTGNLATVASSWRGVADADRASWVTAAPNFPFKNKFGQPYTASGYQLFMSVNTNLLAVGIALTDVAPVPITLLVTPSVSVTCDATIPTTYLLTVRVPADYALILYATVSQSVGRNLTAGRLKAIKVIQHSTLTGVDVTPEYTAVFGTPPVSGNIWFTGVLTSLATGQLCQPYNFLLNY